MSGLQSQLTSAPSASYCLSPQLEVLLVQRAHAHSSAWGLQGTCGHSSHCRVLGCLFVDSQGSECRSFPPAFAGVRGMGPVLLWWCYYRGITACWAAPSAIPLAAEHRLLLEPLRMCPWHFQVVSFISSKSEKPKEFISCHFSGP